MTDEQFKFLVRIVSHLDDLVNEYPNPEYIRDRDTLRAWLTNVETPAARASGAIGQEVYFIKGNTP